MFRIFYFPHSVSAFATNHLKLTFVVHLEIDLDQLVSTYVKFLVQIKWRTHILNLSVFLTFGLLLDISVQIDDVLTSSFVISPV